MNHHPFHNQTRPLLVPCFLLALGVVLALGPVACQKSGDEGRRVESAPAGSEAGGTPGSAALPEGHPPIGGGEPVDPSTVPMKETGSGSLAELERGRAATQVAEAAAAYDQGFRLTFTSDQSKRDYVQARELFNKAIALDPNYAEAYRGLAYAEFNVGFNKDAALANYKKAIELKPDYGEAHYALAFMYAMENPEMGADHFKKAMELGVDDERNLGTQFYSQVKIDTH